MNANDPEREGTSTGDPLSQTRTVDANESSERAERIESLAVEDSEPQSAATPSRRSRHRRTALGLAGLGALAAIAAALVPDAREVLVALAATGLFGGVLTYSLSTGRFIAAEVGEHVYASSAANLAAIAADLDLTDEFVYVPGSSGEPAHLFVPQHAEYVIPEHSTGPVVSGGQRSGLLLTPTGTDLFREFERALTDDLASTPAHLGAQLADGLRNQLELADSAKPVDDAHEGRITISVDGCAIGDLDRFDHPIVSFLGVGCVTALDRPITVDVARGETPTEWLVTCQWRTDEAR